MFSMCSELTPRARIPDTRIPQLMQPWFQHPHHQREAIFVHKVSKRRLLDHVTKARNSDLASQNPVFPDTDISTKKNHQLMNSLGSEYRLERDLTMRMNGLAAQSSW